jgi:antiviral helicase SKI2
LHSPAQPSEFQLRAVRDPSSGEVIDWKEIIVEEAGCTARNSSSLLRAPGPPDEGTRGSAANFPFWPGGMELPPVSKPQGELAALLDPQPGQMLTCPPGFTR